MVFENGFVTSGAGVGVARRKIGSLFVVSSLVFCGFIHAAGELGEAPPSMPDPRTTYSPYLQDSFPNQVFFGDTHLHTAYSADAGFFLNRLTPDDSFAWARGETVTSSTGVPSKIVRPLILRNQLKMSCQKQIQLKKFLSYYLQPLFLYQLLQ